MSTLILTTAAILSVCSALRTIVLRHQDRVYRKRLALRLRALNSVRAARGVLPTIETPDGNLRYF